MPRHSFALQLFFLIPLGFASAPLNGQSFCSISNHTLNRNSFGIAAADLDADGDLDLVDASQSFDTISVYAQTGGALQLSQHLPLPSGLSRLNFFNIAVADLDGNGLPDIVATVTDQLYIAVWAAQGLMTYSSQPTMYRIPSWIRNGRIGCHFLRIADFDNDTYPDIAVSNFQTNHPYIYIGRNGGRAAPGTFSFSIAGALSSGALTLGVGVGDWDGDGDLDLAVSYEGFASPTRPVLARLFFNNGMAAFPTSLDIVHPFPLSSAWCYPGAIKGYEISTGDFDRDGRDDIAILDGCGGVYLTYNTPSGWISRRVVQFLDARCEHFQRAADLDGDGDLDLVISAIDLGTNNSVHEQGVQVAWNPGNIASTQWSRTTIESQIGTGLEVADWDGDGRPDLLGRYGGVLRVHSNCTSGPFASEFGVASFGSRGTSKLIARSRPMLGSMLNLETRALPPARPSVLLIGPALNPVLGLGSTNQFGAPWIFTAPLASWSGISGIDGVWRLGVPLPNDPLLQGAVATIQTVFSDPAVTPLGLSTTAPLRLYLW